MNITDNGIGFKKEAMRSGMGLKIMAYRATLINANLRFRSGINGGTVVQCAFKIEREKETIKRAS
jgi:nitrate/nitrite-specific signal transduction histidine kinase